MCHISFAKYIFKCAELVVNFVWISQSAEFMHVVCVCVYVSVCTFIIIHQSLRNFHSWFSCAALIISIKAHISESVSCIVFACNKNNIDCKQQRKEKKNWTQRKIEKLYTFYSSALYLGGHPSVSDSVWCWFFSSLALII